MHFLCAKKVENEEGFLMDKEITYFGTTNPHIIVNLVAFRASNCLNGNDNVGCTFCVRKKLKMESGIGFVLGLDLKMD